MEAKMVEKRKLKRTKRTSHVERSADSTLSKTPNEQPGNNTQLHLPSRPPRPSYRMLRGYAFDPSLTTSLETALVGEVTYKVPWERLEEGPIGEYVEVVDFDPPSGCFYAPIELDHPDVLAQNGLSPSEGNPQFHQQMVYAVAMTTIDRFERALGRKALWAERYEEATEERFVQRLRIYPHALRMANAYYSRKKMALLFGYFPATEDRRSGQFPGGMVFTCLSHDIITHETTHALLDGFHEHFMEATNPDVLAFHEAFADIVALFQHFTFPEVLSHQIAQTRGNLGTENLLGQLATQFGHARGSHGALRDAIGKYDPVQQQWVKHEPDPTELDTALEVHARGAILVAAVFDAFLSIYHTRSRDLVRLASDGTGRLRDGELHPDLVNRLASEAAKTASHVLNMCIRALDYCPPVDLTFGEYLRALITADMDLMPNDPHRYRVAFIEAFRRRGIYPSNLRTLSEGSLRWARPEEDPSLDPGRMKDILQEFIQRSGLRAHIDKVRYTQDRRDIWQKTRDIRRELHEFIKGVAPKAELFQKLTGLALTGYQAPEGVRVRSDGSPVFQVHALREARRQQEDGRALNQVFMTILQNQVLEHEGQEYTIRCGSTLVLDLDEMQVTYVIRKGLSGQERRWRTNATMESQSSSESLSMTYFETQSEPFAALHKVGA